MRPLLLFTFLSLLFMADTSAQKRKLFKINPGEKGELKMMIRFLNSIVPVKPI